MFIKVRGTVSYQNYCKTPADVTTQLLLKLLKAVLRIQICYQVPFLSMDPESKMGKILILKIRYSFREYLVWFGRHSPHT